MKIYFVRHGESGHNESGIITGWADPALTEKGKQQAEEARAHLPQEVEAIWAADLLRHRQTAEILNQARALPVTFSAGFRERNFGSLEGKRWEDVGSEIIDADREQRYDYQPFGGESVKDVEKRLTHCIEEIKSAHPNAKAILVVTSAGTIRLLYKMYTDKIVGKIENCSIHSFEV